MMIKFELILPGKYLGFSSEKFSPYLYSFSLATKYMYLT